MEALEEIATNVRHCAQCNAKLNGHAYLSPYKQEFCDENCYNHFVSD